MWWHWSRSGGRSWSKVCYFFKILFMKNYPPFYEVWLNPVAQKYFLMQNMWFFLVKNIVSRRNWTEYLKLLYKRIEKRESWNIIFVLFLNAENAILKIYTILLFLSLRSEEDVLIVWLAFLYLIVFDTYKQIFCG